MSVGAVLTLGLGKFGSVNLLPTLGYGQGQSGRRRVGGLGRDEQKQRIVAHNDQILTIVALVSMLDAD